MKVFHTTATTVAVSITAVLGMFGTPAFAHNGEHHEPNNGFNTSIPAFYDHGTLHPSGSGQINGNSPISRTNPVTGATVRKNVAKLTSEDKGAFVNALLTLKNTFLEGSKLSIYDQFVVEHVGSMGMMLPTAIGPAAGFDAAHATAAFLPWHREYLYRFEEALQSVDPTVTIPYWDWTDPNALDIIFQDNFLGPNGTGTTINLPGLGSFEGGAVQSGYFSEANGWTLREDLHINPITNETLGTSLLRFLKLPPGDRYPIFQQEVDQVLAIDDYNFFRPALEGFATDEQGNLLFTQHNYVHGVVGGALFDPVTGKPTPLGTMANILSSPNDPVFWLLHSNVDRLWAEWQENGHAGIDFYPATGQLFGKNLNDPMWPWDGGLSIPGNLGPGDLLSLLPRYAPDDIVTPANVLDFRNLGYTYDTISASVPEPTSTLGLLGLGALGAGSLLKRKRKQKDLSYFPLNYSQLEAEVVKNEVTLSAASFSE
ncbi:tyrosinase family protein [Coleofasciculus sp. F4-SAH-05]|uniref:tyrosinase family protein n=1 Tax=Coleofasciculus sp. F4-SAH-05 TaxID=3069525 RepID=UPI0032FA1592